MKLDFKNKKYVRAINSNTNVITHYNSMTAEKYLSMDRFMIENVCEKTNNCKTGK